MKIIKPSEISSKIMTLIDESDEYVILVSPYVKISKWYKLLKKIDALKARSIPVTFIIRDDINHNKASFQELTELNIDFSSIKNLHCKLYLNEKYAIVASMNLLLSSEINSLELAYQTETEKELEELKEFGERYLEIDFSKKLKAVTNAAIDWRDYVQNLLIEQIGNRVRMYQDNGSFFVKTGITSYSIFIWNTNQNYLKISGILSEKEFVLLQNNLHNLPLIKRLKIVLEKGKSGYYSQVLGILEEPLKSADINNVWEDENELIAKKITGFILAIDDFKKWANSIN